MLIPDNIEEMLSLTHTFGWLVGVNDKLMCEFCRTCGVRKTGDEFLTIIITPSLSKSLIDTIQSNTNIGFTIVNAYTFESYQFKGFYVEHRNLNSEEENIKNLYMQGITDVLNETGFKYGESFRKYSDLDGVSVKMKVNEIFEQTPKQGTGNRLTLKATQL